jgi:hypothetical protein
MGWLVVFILLILQGNGLIFALTIIIKGIGAWYVLGTLPSDLPVNRTTISLLYQTLDVLSWFPERD